MDDDFERRVAPTPGHEWALQPPPALMPVPATEVDTLVDRRVVLWTPEGWWRYDVRGATGPHLVSNRWCIGILSEGDWFRRERDSSVPIVPAPYPLDWIWVEEPVDTVNTDTDLDDQHQTNVGLDLGHARHLATRTDAPPVRYPQPALSFPDVQPGMRACLMTPEGPTWGLRVCGPPRLTPFDRTLNLSAGVDQLDEPPVGPTVPLCWDDQWYWWAADGVPPNATDCWIVPVWLV